MGANCVGSRSEVGCLRFDVLRASTESDLFVSYEARFFWLWFVEDLFALHLEYKDKRNTCVQKQDAAEYETRQSHTKVLLIQTLTERYLVFRIRYVYLQIFSANVAHIAGLWITGCHGCAQGNAIYKGLGRIPIWRFLDIFLLPRY